MPTRRLIITRHAKSDWSNSGAGDHARTLNDRGRRDAPRVAKHLKDHGWSPDAVYSSDSQRTRETWSLMAPVFDEEVAVHWERGLYLAGLADIRASAASWPDGLATVMVLGHNPGWEEAVSMLSGRDQRMTTANAACLTGAGSSWSDALSSSWTLEMLVRPKEI